MKPPANSSSSRAAGASSPSRVLVVDDHLIIAQLLRDYLSLLPGFTCAGVTADGREGLRLILEEQPDFVLLDLHLPNFGGLEVVQELAKSGSRTKIIIFSALNNIEAVRHALQFGVQGFLEKNIKLEELADALNRVKAGEFYVSPAINQALRSIVCKSLRDPLLDGMDLQVLRLFADEMPVKAIADEVGLSQSGVYKVLARVRKKTGTNTDEETVLLATKLGLAPAPSQGFAA